MSIKKQIVIKYLFCVRLNCGQQLIYVDVDTMQYIIIGTLEVNKKICSRCVAMIWTFC